ncbi:MAG: YdcH family protein [Lysobacteraceae bacterium]
MESRDPAQLMHQLTQLRIEHRDLDAAIDRLAADIQADELAIKRLKKRKLLIKDSISRLESRLIPDLDA